MIKLATEKIPKLDRLKKPPTHANCGSLTLTYSPYTKLGLVRVDASYHYGWLDDEGLFTPDPECGTVTITMPTVHDVGSSIPKEHHEKLLANLYAGGRAPHPDNPFQTINAMGKPAGEFRRLDLDAVAAHQHPELLGTVV